MAMIAEVLEILVGIGAWILPRRSKSTPERQEACTVIPIRDTATSGCEQALALYLTRFHARERATVTDMLRWIQEDKKARRNPFRPRDLLLAAIKDGNALGIINFTYYPTFRLAFISYLARQKCIRGIQGKILTAKLVAAARQFLESQLVRCKAVILEVDSPGEAPDPKERNHRWARLKDLAELAEIEGLVLVRLEIDYVAPRPHESGEEVPMLLLYTKLRGRKIETHLSQRQVVRILRFVYTRLYGDSFMHDPEKDRAYRQYLGELLQTQLAKLRSKPAVHVAKVSSLIPKPSDRTNRHESRLGPGTEDG
jgi:hypothetical protein